MLDDELGKGLPALLVLQRNHYFFEGPDQNAERVKVDEDGVMVEEREEEVLGVVGLFSAFLFEEGGDIGEGAGMGVVELEELFHLGLI